MNFNLKILPPKAIRPEPPKPIRWFVALCGLFIAGALFIRISGNQNAWVVMSGILVAVWMLMGCFRLMIYLRQQISANQWDRQREKWILDKTRKSRRAFQILSAEFIAPYSDNSRELYSSLLDAMLDNHNQIISQVSWNGEEGCRHGRISRQPTQTPDGLISASFISLLSALGIYVKQLTDNNLIAVLLESSSSLSNSQIRHLWQQAWRDSGISQPVEYVEGSGLAYAETWLNERIHDDALLLVVAVQIAPETPEGTGEAVAGVLLGNRLTQKTLEPLALLHRPDCSSEDELDKGLEQAAYHVPLNDTKLQHLWQCGLNQAQREAVTKQYQSPLIASVKSGNIYDVDGSLGLTGCVAPWLAVAAAAQAAQKLQVPQMIISSDTGHSAIWSTVVSPVASRQEMNK